MSETSGSKKSRSRSSSNQSSGNYSTTGTSISTIDHSDDVTVTGSVTSEPSISNPETPSTASVADTETYTTTDTAPDGESSADSPTRVRYGLEVINSRDEPWHGLTPRASRQDLRSQTESHEQGSQSNDEDEGDGDGDDTSNTDGGS